MNKKISTLCVALLTLICQIAEAQEQKKFLNDYFLGGAIEQTRIVRDIDELIIARETGKRAILLSRCTNFRTVDTRSEFDSYTEELQRILSGESTSLNALNGFLTLSSAAALNEFSDDDIALLKKLMVKPEYVDAMSYIWFENVMRQITDGLIDVNTAVKQPWVAARSLEYLKNHKLYPLFLSTLTDSAKNLLNQDVFTSLQPTATAKEAKYTEELSQLFEEQLKNKALLRALPKKTIALVARLQDDIDPEVKRANGVLILLSNNQTGLVCKSSKKQNCINNEWFKNAKSIFDANENAKLDIAQTLLNTKYQSLCEKNTASSRAE